MQLREYPDPFHCERSVENFWNIARMTLQTKRTVLNRIELNMPEKSIPSSKLFPLAQAKHIWRSAFSNDQARRDGWKMGICQWTAAGNKGKLFLTKASIYHSNGLFEYNCSRKNERQPSPPRGTGPLKATARWPGFQSKLW